MVHKKTRVDESWTQVNKRTRSFPNEDGSVEQKPVPMYLNPTGTPSFCFKVPHYVTNSIDVYKIDEATADAAEKSWEQMVERYSKWAKGAKAKPIIIVKIESDVTNDRYERSGGRYGCWTSNHATRREISLKYSLAFQINDKFFARQIERVATNPNAKHGDDDYWDRTDVESVGVQIQSPDGVVLDYTSELHQRIDAIAKTLEIAAGALDDLVASKNLGVALLALKPGSLLPAPTKGKT